MDRRQFMISTAASGLLLATRGASFAQDGSDYPSKPIELITHNQPGAVMDVMSRLIADIAQQESLLSQPITVVNKPGAGGGASLGYLLEKRGDPHAFLATPLSNIINLPHTEDVPYTYDTFTPIANLIADGSLLVVNSSSPYMTIEDLIADAKARPGALNMGITSQISSNTVMARDIMDKTGTKWEFVTFASIPESIVAVLNGTVEIGFANPAYTREHIEAGTLRPLLTGSLQKFPGNLDAPTIEEKGLGTARVSYRGFFGPPEMPEYAVSKLEAMLKAVFETQRFKEYMAQNMMQDGWTSAADYPALLKQQDEQAIADLTAADMLKH